MEIEIESDEQPDIQLNFMDVAETISAGIKFIWSINDDII